MLLIFQIQLKFEIVHLRSKVATLDSCPVPFQVSVYKKSFQLVLHAVLISMIV